jgi:hypothetical protein
MPTPARVLRSPSSAPPAPAPLPRRDWAGVALYSLGLGIAAFFIGRYSAAAARRTDAAAPRHLPLRAAAGLPANSPAAQPAPWSQAAWRQARTQPNTKAGNAAHAALLESLAATDPQGALALAEAEGNRVLRRGLEQAVLRGWARTAPLEAIKWTFGQSNLSDRSDAMATVFDAAVAADPEMALQAAKAALPLDPGNSVGYGAALVNALCDAGDFSQALQFASSGDDRQRSTWLGETYEKWAALQPQEAAADAAALSDPEARSAALHGVVGGWSQADPGGLTRFLMQLPADADRATMVGQALQDWVKVDGAAASQWINNSAGSPDLDQGVAAVATMDALKPDIAVGWATSISDTTLRSATLATVLRSWAQTDFAAAQQYFQTTGDLQPADRQQVAQVLTNLQGH